MTQSADDTSLQLLERAVGEALHRPGADPRSTPSLQQCVRPSGPGSSAYATGSTRTDSSVTPRSV